MRAIYSIDSRVNLIGNEVDQWYIWLETGLPGQLDKWRSWLSENEIAEFLTKPERKICKNTRNILLDECHLLFEDYL